jgi:hypothetical protein
MGGNVTMRKSNGFVWGYVAGGGTRCQRLHEVSLGDLRADRGGRVKGVCLTRLGKSRKALE